VEASGGRMRAPTAKSVQAKQRKTKENQGKSAWIFLDFLGFLRPFWAFSMGYERSE
jgi:hypothetical protein